MPQHVGAQQHLTVAALKPTHINLVLGQHNPARRVLGDGPATHEYLPTTNPGHDSGHQRIFIGTAQPDDHVLDAAHDVAGAGDHWGAQQL